ncbi:hypothetical protein L7F22_058113 [Adiantum nelumboides]|nr:hypothetical protein [Adiantum nelumboides]
MSKTVKKWIVELQEFVEKSTRATLTNLLTYKESPLLIKEEHVRRPTVETFEIENAFFMYFDGSFRKSHDATLSSIVIYDPQGVLVRKQGLKVDAKSNIEAENVALECGLQIYLYLQLGIHRLRIKGDASLVVKQVLRVWKNKNPNSKGLCMEVKQILKRFEAWSIQHIDCLKNKEAHNVAQRMIIGVFITKADTPLYHVRETLSKEAEFLQTGILPEDLLLSKKYDFMQKAGKSLALDHYEKALQTSQEKENEKVKDKGIKKEDLELRHNSKLDNTFQKKFQIEWEGSFCVIDKFKNETYQLSDLDDTPNKYRVNGYILKKYLARLMSIVKEDMYLIDENNVNAIESAYEASREDLCQLFTLETTACHE